MAVRIRACLCLRLVAGRTSVTCLVTGWGRVSERRPPGRSLEGPGELLGLVRYRIGGDLHDAHSVGGRPVISDHDVAHPQVATAPDAHETGGLAGFGADGKRWTRGISAEADLRPGCLARMVAS
jgi:hypothetical protein